MAKYTDTEILYFQARAKRLKMTCPDEFYRFDPATLAKICNGVGGDGSSLTPIINWVYAKYQTTAAIHDVDYWLGGDEEDRLAADKGFLANAYKEWADYWGWFRWFRPLAWAERRQIQAAYLAVRNFGARYFQHRQEAEQ
jgi:hypothetical protein